MADYRLTKKEMEIIIGSGRGEPGVPWIPS
jgi:hypothetical protein